VTAARNEQAVALRRLLPDAGSLTADQAAAQLDFAGWAPDERPYVAVNMVATVDGRASVAGRTAPISSVADRQVFHALRTRVDAVMVGAGTLRTERYGRLVRDEHRRKQRVAAGHEADPVAIVVSGRLDLPADLPLLQDASSRVIVVTAAEHALPDCPARVSYVRRSPVDLGAELGSVRAEHGIRSILCEGGPRLNASLFAAGLVDELFLTTYPTLAGGAGALTIIGDAPLRDPLGVRLQWLLECDGELFARYRVGAPAAR